MITEKLKEFDEEDSLSMILHFIGLGRKKYFNNISFRKKILRGTVYIIFLKSIIMYHVTGTFMGRFCDYKREKRATFRLFSFLILQN